MIKIPKVSFNNIQLIIKINEMKKKLGTAFLILMLSGFYINLTGQNNTNYGTYAGNCIFRRC